MPHLIALIGPAGSGKTTLANQLSLWRNFIKKPFAANLKSMLAVLLRNQGLDSIAIDRMLNGDLKETPSPYFGGRSPRHAMQTLGTDWREMLDRNLWVDAWEREVRATWQQLPDVDIIVDDMRFKHEAERVRQLGGRIIEIRRPGYGIGSHVSEYEFLSVSCDGVIWNDAEPKAMFNTLTQLMISELNEVNKP